MTAVPSSAPYVLGHSDNELARLGTQARLIDPITRRYFTEAGIAAGMRVMDVGSGAGDVAVLVAALVGTTGEVVGVDRASAAIAAATERVRAAALPNVSFRVGSAAELTFDRPFDAIVGRYVLMFQADPAHMLRQVAAHLRTGGIIVFHEPDWEGVRSFPPVPTYDRCCEWLVQTLQRSGADPRLGGKLHSTFIAAGLSAPTMRLESVIAGGASVLDHVRFKTDLVRTLLPEMERLGVATEREVQPMTLDERIQAEMAAARSIIVGRAEIGAWSRR